MAHPLAPAWERKEAPAEGGRGRAGQGKGSVELALGRLKVEWHLLMPGSAMPLCRE